MSVQCLCSSVYALDHLLGHLFDLNSGLRTEHPWTHHIEHLSHVILHTLNQSDIVCTPPRMEKHHLVVLSILREHLHPPHAFHLSYCYQLSSPHRSVL